MLGRQHLESEGTSRTPSSRVGSVSRLAVVLVAALITTTILPGALAGDPGTSGELAHAEDEVRGVLDRGSEEQVLSPATKDNAETNLDAAVALLEATRDGTAGTGIQLAQLSIEHKVGVLGAERPDAIPGPRYEAPSLAADELAHRYGVSSANHQAALEALDTLDEPRRGALADVLNAFLAVQAATDKAYADVSLEEISANVDADDPALASNTKTSGNPAGYASLTAADNGVNVAPVLAAQHNLLAAAAQLNTVWHKPTPALGPGPSSAASGPVIDLCPALALDLSGSNTAYTADCALIVDVGGQDTYENNAGGGDQSAAALIDLGDGNDEYRGTGDGVHGGAILGSGFLLDAGGNDEYDAAAGTVQQGANGGGALAGVGSLVDLGGNDKYTPSATGAQRGVNGGGYLAGQGSLVDVAGNDQYEPSVEGTQRGANGGGYLGGTGALIDAGGNDGYNATAEALQQGTNGGATVTGVGLLVDSAGDDAYDATAGVRQNGVNGAGFLAAAGSLVDAGGDDAYEAFANGSQQAANGGGGLSAVGVLVDSTGNDTYTATAASTQHGVNGGANLGLGALVDGQGVDRFEDDAFTCDNADTDDCTTIPKGTIGALVDGDIP